MTYQEVKTMVASIGYPYAYFEFKDGPVQMPFVVFYYPANQDVYADGSNYVKVEQLIIELYTSNKDFTAEAAVENVLKANNLVWTRAEKRWESENSYEVIFSTEVIINEQQSEIQS